MMAEMLTIEAVYENGMLRPLQPLHLMEKQKVRIQVAPEETEAEAAVRRLVEMGRLTPPPGQSDVAPVSPEERIAVADRLGCAPGKSVSEIIIEDRGDW